MLGVDWASVLQNRLLVESELAQILALALAYHPLVDLTPFSVATAGGVVRKLERGSEGKESARKNIQSCLKLLKCKKAGDISGIEGLVFVCGHEALFFSILWTCES